MVIARLAQVMLLVVCAALPAVATTFTFNSDVGASNLDSAGAAMDGGYVFEVGVFSGGFEPTPGNLGEWLGNWHAAEEAVYETAPKRFTALHAVLDNDAPFVLNAKGWVFGRRTTATGSEWILFRAASWLWPVGSPSSDMMPPTMEWNAKDATVVVVGAVNGSGSPFLMKSAAVSSWAQFQTAELGGAVLDGPSQDADGDGVANILEFAFGTSPTTPGVLPPMPHSLVDIGGSRYLQMSIPRRHDRLASLVVEVSSDMAVWQSGPAFTTVVSNGVEALVVRDLVPFAGKRFMRVRAGPLP